MHARQLLAPVWVVAVAGLALWSLLAWGTGALLSGSGDWISTLATAALESARLEAWIDTGAGWAERLGLVAVWALWALGSIGLLLTAIFATVLLRRRQSLDMV